MEVMVIDWPEELSGVLLLREQRAVTGLNGRYSRERRHFTFWHEVGHYLRHG